MIGWLYRIIIGRFTSCEHKWEILETRHLMTGPNRHITQHIQMCKHCGKLDQRTL